MAILSLLLKPPFLLYIIFLMAFQIMVKAAIDDDSEALLRIKQSLNNPLSLESWIPGTNPCDEITTWAGLLCTNGVVSSLRLRSMNLSGNIDLTALEKVKGLRILSLVNNSFAGPIPEFNRLGALKALYLSMNQFSGEILQDYFIKMVSLKRLWLDGNNFIGQIPSSLAQLPNLQELHLQANRFTGTIPSFSQPTLESLNLSYNNLTGEVPSSLSRFDVASFEGNPGLCGPKFGRMCENVAAGPPPIDHGQARRHFVYYSIMVLCAVILLLMVVGIYVLMKKRDRNEMYEITKNDSLDRSIGLNISSISNDVGSGSGRKSVGSGRKSSSDCKNKKICDIVLLDEKKGKFGLVDLMKATAEVLGNGPLGSSYKATMSNGTTVVVKRLKDMNKVDKDGFDHEMRTLARLNHPNILTPLACHYRKEEKLLVYDYIPRGNLLHLLHGDRRGSRGELKWGARLKIIKGIAHALGYLHNHLDLLDLPHGNLKSSNVLIGPDHTPLVVDFGLITMINSDQVSNVLLAYRAPEAAQSHQVSPKCDVYCLGIVILETLTRKYPSQYLNNRKDGTDVVQWVKSAIIERREGDLFDSEIAGSARSRDEMVKLLRIGAACTDSDPDKRLDLREVIRRIDMIKEDEDKTYQMAPSFSALGSPFLGNGGESRNENDGESDRRTGDSFVHRMS